MPSRVQRQFPAAPDVVYEALRRAIDSSFETQGGDPRVRTVYFKSGRTNMSGSVSAAPDGSAVVSLVGASPALFDRVAGELEELLEQARATRAAQSTIGSADFAADLERLGNLHERGLLTEVEYANAKARVLKGERSTEPSESALQPSAEHDAPPSSEAAAQRVQPTVPPPSASLPSVPKDSTGMPGLAQAKALWSVRSRRGKIAIIVGAVVLGLALLGALIPSEDQAATSTTTSSAETQTIDDTVVEETTASETIDPSLDRRTREYIAQVNTCQVTVGLTLLMIQRGETDPFEIADSAGTAAETCETIKSNLAQADTDHFDDQALLAWSGVSEMKSGMNALLAYLDDPRPTKLIEVRDKIQKGDAQAAEGIRQINQRRVVFGLRKIQS